MDLGELVEQVPALVVLAFIVVKFLAHLRDHTVVIRENSKVLGEAIALLRKMNGHNND